MLVQVTEKKRVEYAEPRDVTLCNKKQVTTIHVIYFVASHFGGTVSAFLIYCQY